MGGVRDRGHVNTATRINVAVDPATLAAAVEAAVVDATVVINASLAHELRPQAVVDRAIGVTRAFYKTPWSWEPRTLMRVLYLASLRG